MRILTIDDSKVIHSFLTSILEPDHAVLTHAYDGTEGLKVLESSGEKSFDLILLDWEMPKMSGIETLKQIRSWGFGIPIVMLTTKNSPQDIQLALESGASEYIMKPFVSDILLEKLAETVGRVA